MTHGQLDLALISIGKKLNLEFQFLRENLPKVCQPTHESDTSLLFP